MSDTTNKFDDTIYKEPYYAMDGCLYEEVIKNGKTFMVKLCDYVPVLRSEITYDDGTDTKKVFEVTAEHSTAGTLSPVKVTAEDMRNMTWLLDKWGALGSYSPAGNTAAHIRHAITMTKKEIDFRTVYSQTGWREIDGEWFFLMPQENSLFTVELQGKLKSYHFGQKCSDGDLIYLTAMLDDGFIPQRLMLPLLSFTFLAPLNCFMRLGNHEPRFIVNLVGKTGTRKSSSAAVFLSFFGDFNAGNLPNSFHDTANSILANIYYTKDILTCVDDLHPNGRYGDNEMKCIAQNLSRYYGDRTGRSRLTPRGEYIPGKPPTGLCLTTSEFVADISQSGLARYFILEMKEGDVDLDLLSEYQKLAADGILNGIMHSYVDWIKEKYLEDADEFVKKLSALFVIHRTEMISELCKRDIVFHNRVPEMLASLKIGFDILLEFLCDKEQIGKGDIENYKTVFDEILIENVRRSSTFIENESISYQFCEKLESLIDSGRCSLNMLGNDTDLGRKGFIGFEDDTHYYLIMNAAMSEINKLSRELGDSFSVGRNNLIQQLADDKIIITNGKRNTTTIRAGTSRMISVAVLDKVRIESLLSGSVCPPTSEVGQVGE